MGWLVRLWNDKWLGLVMGMWIQSCGGLSYVFSLYSGRLKHRMHYNQEQIDGLGTAKDIGGNVGVLSGLLANVMPAWATILIGAVLNTYGYLMLWLGITRQLKPTYWQMCAYICVGTNGATWFNTAVLVTCMRNFSSERGVVVGLLVGVIGLSGAIFTQVYIALLAPDEESFLLLAAVLPSVVSMAAMFFIRPVEATKAHDDSDRRSFTFCYTAGVLLAAYLLVIILVQDMFDIARETSFLFLLLTLFMLLLPSAVPVLSITRNYMALSTVAEAVTPRTLPLRAVSSIAPKPVPIVIAKPRHVVHSTPSSPQVGPVILKVVSEAGAGILTQQHQQQQQQQQLLLADGRGDTAGGDGSGASLPGGKEVEGVGGFGFSKSWKGGPRLGQDFTLLQACCTEEYWLLFIAMGCGTGSGLTAINNLAQMAEALGSDSVDAYVSLLSVWNFVGRLAAGYISEWFVKQYAIPRPLFLVVVLVAMGIAHILFATSVVSMLYLGSVLVGLSHGAHWSLMVAIASELFGLQNFGMLYNTLSISSTVGSYLCSVKLAGYIYDQQVVQSRQRAELDAAAGFVGQPVDPETCLGPECFQLTFCIMAVVCFLGVLLCVRLAYRSRQAYQDLQVSRRPKWPSQRPHWSPPGHSAPPSPPFIGLDDGLHHADTEVTGQVERRGEGWFRAAAARPAERRHHASSRMNP